MAYRADGSSVYLDANRMSPRDISCRYTRFYFFSLSVGLGFPLYFGDTSASSVPKDVSVVLALRTLFRLMAPFFCGSSSWSYCRVDLRVGWNDDASHFDKCVFDGGGHCFALSYSTACQTRFRLFPGTIVIGIATTWWWPVVPLKSFETG